MNNQSQSVRQDYRASFIASMRAQSGHSVLEHYEPPYVDLFVDRTKYKTEFWAQFSIPCIGFIVLTVDHSFFRVFGYGLSWRRASQANPTFSERFGYKHVHRFGNNVMELLKPKYEFIGRRMV